MSKIVEQFIFERKFRYYIFIVISFCVLVINSDSNSGRIGLGDIVRGVTIKFPGCPHIQLNFYKLNFKGNKKIFEL
jgi:hypothetical protein